MGFRFNIPEEIDENTPMWKLRLYSFLLHMNVVFMSMETKKFINDYLKEHPELHK